MDRRKGPRPSAPAIQCRRAARDAWLAERQGDIGNLTLRSAFTQGWEAALLAIKDAATADDAGRFLWDGWRKAAGKHMPMLPPAWDDTSEPMRVMCAEAALAAVERAVQRVKWSSGDLGGKAQP